MTDLSVIRGYAALCGRIANERCDDLSAAVDDLADAFDQVDTARAIAEAKHVEADRALDYATRLATFAAQAMAGDVAPSVLADAADAIRKLVGPIAAEESAA